MSKLPRNASLKTCDVCNTEQVVFNRIVTVGKSKKRRTITPDRLLWKNDTCPSCRWTKKAIPKVIKPVPELLGPKFAPKPKLHSCMTCAELTVNKFHCTHCLSKKVSAVGEAEFFAQGVLV